MDDDTIDWSDALGAEATLLSIDEVPPPPEDLRQFGTLGRALWRERSLAAAGQRRSPAAARCRAIDFEPG